MPYLNGQKYKEWMEGKTIIEKLITKYADKSLEEPSYYFHFIEFVEDLQSLLKLYPAQNILEMLKFARHIYIAGDGKDIDTCKKCGHDIRHIIHFRYGKNINEYTEDKTV